MGLGLGVGAGLSLRLTGSSYVVGSVGGGGEVVTPPTGSAPSNVSAPTISGIAYTGQTLTANAGTWSNSPTSKSYQWRADSSDIMEATGSSLVLTDAMIGKVITFVETATNSFGSGVGVSSPTSPVIAAPTLSALSLSANSISEGSVSGTVIGDIVGLTSGSTVSLTDDAGGRFSINSLNQIVTGSVATDYGTATSHSITIREAFGPATNTPRSTTLTVDVTTPEPNYAGGVTFGTAGGVGTLYEGFTLLYGDEFDVSSLSWWGGSNTSGRYSSQSPTAGVRRINVASARQLYIDPNYRGVRSTSPAALGYDKATVSSSIVTIQAEPTPTALLPYLPTDYTGLGDASNKPRLISACLDSWPSFILAADGDYILAAKMRCPSGVARGWWPAFWHSTLYSWPDRGEIDVNELKKDASGNVSTQGNVIISNSDGAGVTYSTVYSGRSIPAAQWVTYVVKKQGNSVYFYDDKASTGTLALVATYTDATRVGRFRGGHRVRLELAVSSSWDGSTFNIADWPSSVDVDWWQVWTPTSTYSAYSHMTVLDEINVSPGGSWATTLPSQSTLYGSTPDLEEIVGAYDNPDCPGYNTSSVLPSGMIVDTVTRSVSGTVPSTYGGKTGLLLVGSSATHAQAKAAIQYYNVAPAVQGTLFSSQSVVPDVAWAQTINYNDFHSGNLGPHSYSVTADDGWVTITYGSANQSVSISGTPTSGDAGTTTITISCTNAIGQTSVVTRTIVVASDFLSDSFTVSSDTTLAAHSPEAGGAWISAANTMTVRASGGYADGSSSTSTGIYYNDATPGSADYTVEAVMQRTPADTTTFHGNGVLFRFQNSTNYYAAYYSDTTASTPLRLVKVIGGTETVLSQVLVSFPANTDCTIKVVALGSSLKVYWNGTQVISSTDTAIATAGKVGIRGRTNGKIMSLRAY